MEAQLIGYFPGQTIKVKKWPEAPGVVEICSANRGHTHWPENWYHQGRHNGLMHFDSEEIAWTVLEDEIVVILTRDDTLDPPWRAEIMRLPCEEFDLYAYKVFPIRFVEGREEEFQLVLPQTTPLPGDYEKLGYDVVDWSGESYFGCCPLSCNGEAAKKPVNRYCLLDDVAPARDMARYYSEGTWEPGPHYCGQRDPGPYCVVEVWRKRKPFAAPKRIGEPFKWPADLLHRLVQHKLGHGGVFERIG